VSEWQAAPPLPGARSGFACVTTPSGLLLAVGGTPPAVAASVQRYDPATQTWSALPDLPTPRYFLGAALLDGVLYAAGGVLLDGSGVTAAFEAYDLAQETPGQWQTLPPLPQAQEALGCVAACCGRLWVVGGFYGNYPTGYPLDTVWAYDPAARAWARMPPVPVARETAAVVSYDGRLYSCGGYTGSQGLADVVQCDPRAPGWTPCAPMPTARSGHGVAVSGDRLYVLGGLGTGGAFLSSVESYAPACDTWRTEPPLPVARHLTQAGASGMRLYSLGGLLYGAGPQAAVYQYDRTH
jgi:N-acetylneuraminic acid mutarotase